MNDHTVPLVLAVLFLLTWSSVLAYDAGRAREAQLAHDAFVTADYHRTLAYRFRDVAERATEGGAHALAVCLQVDNLLHPPPPRSVSR